MSERPIGGWRRGLATGAGLAVILVAIGVAGYLSSGLPSSNDRGPGEEVRLVAVPGGVAAVSLRHGPFVTDRGRASGFGHDELGAALAASNLAPRVTAGAGPDVYGPTLAEQCWGDVAAADAHTAQTLPQLLPAQDSLGVRTLLYRVIGGDPTGDQVVVSLLADTGQSRAAGGLARVDLTLRWSGTDWQLRVPVAPPAVQADVTGYTMLGAAA